MPPEEIEQHLKAQFGDQGPKTSAAGAAGRGFLTGLVPTGAAVGTGVALEAAAAPESLGASLLLIPPTLAAGWLAGKLQQKAIHAAAPEFEKLQQADVEQHPWATTAGEVAAAAPFARFSPGTILRPGKAVIPASIGATVGAVQPLIEGRKTTAQDIAGGIAGATLFGGARFGHANRLATIAKAAETLPRAAKEAAVNAGVDNERVNQEKIAESAEKAPKTPQDDLAGVNTPPASETPPQPQAATPASPLATSTELSPEDQAHIDAERGSVSAPVEVVPEPANQEDPFARRAKGQFMGINRAKGTIEIYPQEFARWLKGVPEDRRAEAVRSRLAEEGIHLKTSDADAQAYWDRLSGPERAIEERIYTGRWGGREIFGLNEIQLGHEAIRRRLQQLARMKTSEVAEAATLNRWGLKGLEATSSAIRNIRETLGTHASTTQSAILDRLQGNTEAAMEAVSGQPAAIRKSAAEDKTPGFYLPDMPRGAQRESAFPTQTQRLIDSAAEHHFDQQADKPSFERFRGELASQFGSAVPRDQAWHAWKDAMTRRLMGAPGAHLTQMVDQVGAWKDIARGLKPNMKDPTVSRDIPDPIDIDRLRQAQFEELAKQFPHRKAPTPAEVRRHFGPQMQKRYAAIGAILDKLTQEAGPAPEKSLTSEVGPEDVQQIMGERQWHTFTPEQAKSLKTVQDTLTTGAAVSGSPTRSWSKMLVAARNRATGKIEVLSTWKDPRSGPRVTSTEGGDKSVPLDNDWLRSNEPMAAIQTRDPRQYYRRSFDTRGDFDKFFGDVGIEGTEGLETSSFVGPEAGVANIGMGKTGASGKAPAAERPLLPKIKTTVAEALERAGISREQFLPQRSDHQTGSRELTLPRFARKSVPAEAIPPSEPIAAKTAETLTPEELRQVQEAANKEYPPRYPETVYKQLANRQVPAERYRVGGPAAINKAFADDIRAVTEAFKGAILNRTTDDLIARSFDDASNLPHNAAREVESGIRLQSIHKPGFLKRLTTQWTQGNARVLKAATAMVQAGAVKATGAIDMHPAGAQTQLKVFRSMIEAGRIRGENRLRSKSFRERRLGRVDLRAYKELKEGLDYAIAHYGDAELQATASRTHLALDGLLNHMKANGIDVNHTPNFMPGRYDMSAWNGRLAFFEMPKIWGQKFREPKVFKNYYEAFAKDTYVPATMDAASLTGHATRKGLSMISRDQWLSTLNSMKTPAGDPLATDPSKTPTGRHVGPNPSYDVVNIGGKFLAVKEEFAPIVKAMTGESYFEKPGFVRGLLHLEQLLKHTLLIGDFFHFARMGYYGASIMGAKGLAGWRSGWSTLDIAEHDIPEAVRRGIINQSEADWGSGLVQFGRRKITRRELVRQSQQNMVGFNVGHIQDALYKDVFTQLTPAQGGIKRTIAAATDPTTGRYNRFLFDKLTRGLMSRSLVMEFERQSKAKPAADHIALLRDISRDLNNYYGNIGRQGWFKSRTAQDMARMFMLAPQWVEGLVKKEGIGYSRLSGLSTVTGQRKGLTALGSTGRGIGRGLLFMFGAAQAINLLSRHKPTWQNEEKEHKFDAWVPSMDGKEGEGFWLSPLAVFNEITHDLYRLGMAKPKMMDAIDQIAGNKESPLTRAALIALTGQTAQGEQQTTSLGQLGAAAKAIAPMPITFGRLGQYAGNKLAPGLVSAPYPGSVQRQLFSAGGLKIEPQSSIITQVNNLAKDFMRKSGLAKETGWRQEATDQPGYSKLRQYLRAGDDPAARSVLQALQKTHSDEEIVKAMKGWSKRPFTGSDKTEKQFLYSLSDEELGKYSHAQEQRVKEMENFIDFYLRQ